MLSSRNRTYSRTRSQMELIWIPTCLWSQHSCSIFLTLHRDGAVWVTTSLIIVVLHKTKPGPETPKQNRTTYTWRNIDKFALALLFQTSPAKARARAVMVFALYTHHITISYLSKWGHSVSLVSGVQSRCVRPFFASTESQKSKSDMKNALSDLTMSPSLSSLILKAGKIFEIEED